MYIKLQAIMDADIKLHNAVYARNYKRFLVQVKKDPLRAEQILEYPRNLCDICNCKRPCFCESNHGRLMKPRNKQQQSF